MLTSFGLASIDKAHIHNARCKLFYGSMNILVLLHNLSHCDANADKHNPGKKAYAG